MSGHTPGPWEMSAPMGRDHLYGAEPWFWVSGRHTLHIQVAAYSDGFVRGANEANARLIAAAPTLLEQAEHNKRTRDAVDRLLSEAGYQDDSSVRNLLACMNFDAIARATGAGYD